MKHSTFGTVDPDNQNDDSSNDPKNQNKSAAARFLISCAGRGFVVVLAMMYDINTTNDPITLNKLHINVVTLIVYVLYAIEL